ncbi:MAG TPA: flagellar hook-associated protein FlgK [Candidatus Didemnitutus sp.]|nr:flagellar hook-associated protein FlgK [Candidatus Didemnitutus sp.]
MSGLFSSLSASVQSLAAQSAAINTASKNLANMNNASYARQRVIFSDLGTVQTPQGPQSMGLEASGIQQLRDPLLDQQVVREIAITSSYTTQQQFLQNAQTNLGQTINNVAASNTTGSSAGTGGLSAALDDFFNSFQSLAASPTDVGERQTLLQKAGVLTDTINQMDTNLAQVQTDATTQIQSDVTTVNQLLNQVATLNKQIASVEIGKPNSAVDLRDQRQAVLEQLAAKLPVDTSNGANGMIQVTMKDASNNNVLLVNGASVTGPVTFTGTGLTAGASATAVQFSSGSIYGALTTRDGAVQDMRDALDNISNQLVTTVNAAYNPSATAGGDFFDPAGTTAGTITLQSGLTASNLVAGTGAAGDNSIALAVAAVANQTFSTSGSPPDLIDGTINQYYGGAVSSLGQSLSTMNTLVDNQTSVQNLVTSQRNSVSGVSMDEEMADLVRYQTAYQASARVFSTIDSLLDTVVNHLGSTT